jgi:hypothetical protein
MQLGRTIVMAIALSIVSFAADQSPAEKELLKTETEMYSAFLHSDLATLNRLLTEDAVWIGPVGMLGKEAHIQLLEKGLMLRRSVGAKDSEV